MTIRALEFRKGMAFEDKGNVYVVLECNIVKPGKGASFVSVKVRDLDTGVCLDKAYGLTESFNKVKII